MQLQIIQPLKALNKAYLKEKVGRLTIDVFKTNLLELLSKVKNAESEEHHKYPVADFLKSTWYGGKYEINTKGRTDFVIHNGKSTNDSVGVIIEVKRPANKTEMITVAKPNVKALHELVLYYLKERIEAHNTDIKRLVVTNVLDWYIFDESWFETHVYRSKLKQDYETFVLSGKDTKFFFESIAKPFFDSLNEPVPCTYINLGDYERILTGKENGEDNQLIPLFKVLSPVHMLLQPFANDSNTLDTAFYAELLHIMGLEEIKEGSKKLIRRKANPETASLLENAIIKLQNKDCIRNINGLANYGATKSEQLFNVALELCITWVNRIIFIKLLEGQIVAYNKGDKDCKFLNLKNTGDFVELNELFFQVLAEPVTAREDYLKIKFKYVPYLNSSLFERTSLERETIQISDLNNKLELNLHNATVLKNASGKQNTGSRATLSYLFDFLDAYDFSSDGGSEIQEENKNLINASVLGLIFEKINGYKDGSFFTPGFITMYMCSESIRKAVLQKFKDAKGWDCKSIDELYNFIGQDKKKEANEIINSLKICDPAVGSGHFLVSALNEIIAIKSDLKILQDRQGKQLRDYNVSIENDVLVITDEDGRLLDYNPKNKESQRVQVALFHEKETIIENCLFGVDINPNSVKICQLRLWIELLKHTYYTEKSNYTELETLPNLDINIKCGNSLISRFPLDADLSKALKNSKWNIDSYQISVQTYRRATDKEQKREMEELINNIKSNFRTEISSNDPRVKKLQKLSTDYFLKYQADKLFGSQLDKDQIKDKDKFETEITKLDTEIKEIKSSKLYENAFEWRFEFPEVLGNDGAFLGFDVVLGNPPYIPLENLNASERDFFRIKFKYFERKFETSVLFVVQGFELIATNGLLSFIAPVTWQTGENYTNFRKFLFTEKGLSKIVNLPFNVFAEAYVDTAIYVFNNKIGERYKIFSFKKQEKIENIFNVDFIEIKPDFPQDSKFKIVLNPIVNEIYNRLNQDKFITLGEITISTQGLAGSSFPIAHEANNINNFPFLNGGNVYNYYLEVTDVYNTNLDSNPSLKRFYEAVPKLLIRRIINRQNRLSVGYTENRMVFKKDINPFIPINKDYNPKFLLAIMASKLISFIYLNMSSIASKDDFRQTTLAELRELPIPKINKNEQNPLIELANKILILKKDKNRNEENVLEQEIDQLVYQLYGLTGEEIKLIESSF